MAGLSLVSLLSEPTCISQEWGQTPQSLGSACPCCCPVPLTCGPGPPRLPAEKPFKPIYMVVLREGEPRPARSSLREGRCSGTACCSSTVPPPPPLCAESESVSKSSLKSSVSEKNHGTHVTRGPSHRDNAICSSSAICPADDVICFQLSVILLL